MANVKDSVKGNGSNAKPLDTTDWEKEQVGFDPYFVIEEGKSFVGTLIGRDDTQKNFTRYQFIATEDMDCQRGPNDVQNERFQAVKVKQGETFNISSFYSLAKLLDEYVDYSTDTSKAVIVKVKCTGSVKTTENRDCWLWEAFVPPAVKMELRAWRSQHAPMRLKAGVEAQRAALES